VPEKSSAEDEKLGVGTSVPEKKIELDLPEKKSSARRRSVRSLAQDGDDRWGRRRRRSLGTRARQWGRGRDVGDEGATVGTRVLPRDEGATVGTRARRTRARRWGRGRDGGERRAAEEN